MIWHVAHDTDVTGPGAAHSWAWRALRAELAYTYQVLKDCDKSIETCRRAAFVAERGSEGQVKSEDLGRA
jgi:hypothetical protein